MSDVENAFACFAEKKQANKTKVDRMVELLPHVEKAVANGYLLSEVLVKASALMDCQDLKLSSLYSLYVRAKKKSTKNAQPHHRLVPPVQMVPDIDKPKPAPQNPAPIEIEVAKPVEKTPPAKPGDAEAVRKHLSTSPSPAEMHRAASEANAKLKLLAKECGEWSRSKGYWGTRQKEAGEVVREWMYAEPGRREMIQDLARAALRVEGSRWADAEVISDKRLEIVIASAGYRLAHENAIYAAEHPGWVPAVAA